MAVFTYVNENGAAGIIMADDIVGAAEIISGYTNTDVAVRELKPTETQYAGAIYEWDDEGYDDWPWLITKELGYKFKLCKREDAEYTPWGLVQYTTEVYSIDEEAK